MSLDIEKLLKIAEDTVYSPVSAAEIDEAERHLDLFCLR
jgi:hypothetical protein